LIQKKSFKKKYNFFKTNPSKSEKPSDKQGSNLSFNFLFFSMEVLINQTKTNE